MVIEDRKQAELIKKGIEGFANNTLLEQHDLLNFWIRNDLKMRKGETIQYLEQVKRLLTEMIYTGFIEYAKWDIGLKKGYHEPLISLETYYMVQEKISINGRMKFKMHTYDKDFPLRGYVLCSCCNQKITASFSTGRNGTKYPNYRCNNRACDFYSKGINKNDIERDFVDLLRGVSPFYRFSSTY